MNGIAKIKETDALALGGIDAEEYDTLMRLLMRMRQNLIDSLGECRREKKE